MLHGYGTGGISNNDSPTGHVPCHNRSCADDGMRANLSAR